MVHGCVRDVITKNLANRRKNAKSKLDGSRDTRRSRGDETTARARVRIRMPDVPRWRSNFDWFSRWHSWAWAPHTHPANRICNDIRGNFRKFPPNDTRRYIRDHGKSRWNFQNTDGMSINFGYLGNLRIDDEKKENENWKILIDLFVVWLEIYFVVELESNNQ